MVDFKLECVLFDLDGTLVDTAPDLLHCLNITLQSQGFAPISQESAKPLISYGALAMINHAVQHASADQKNDLLVQMLDCYQQNIALHSRLYPGMADILDVLETTGIKWGVVTNKRQRFTLPLMQALDLENRAACIVSGDSTSNPKPHPDPMLLASRQVGIAPENCVFVGDAAHDITAGKSANMKTLAALYGYLRPDDQPKNWGADALIDHPQQLLQWIKTSLCL